MLFHLKDQKIKGVNALLLLWEKGFASLPLIREGKTGGLDLNPMASTESGAIQIAMSLLNRIKKMIGLGRHEIFRRWPASELEEKKLYLENKHPEEFTTADYYLAAEWIIQRHLPEGEDPTPEQWSKTIGDIRQKIDINIKKNFAGERVKTEYVRVNPYTLTMEDFLKDLVPTFASFSLLPDPYLNDRQGNELWIWTLLFEFTQPYSYRHGEARHALILFCDPYTAEKLVQDLARTYTSLRRAKTEGSSKIKVVCTGKQCPACMDLDGKKLGVQELLACFKNGKPSFPHMIENEEAVSWCPAPHLSPELPLSEGDDSEFHAWLVKHLE